MTATGKNSEIKVLLADDHDIVRAGIRRLLSIDKSIKIVDEAKNGIDTVDLVAYHKPDVALVDILMPRLDGIEATKKIKSNTPETIVVMLTAFEDYSHIEKSLSAGANGYLSKDISAKDLVKSIRTVLQGERVFSKSILSILQKKLTPDKSPDSQVVITRREQEVLDLVAEGKTSQQISDILNISVRTVESHRYNLMQKLEVKNTAALVKYKMSKSSL